MDRYVSRLRQLFSIFSSYLDQLGSIGVQFD